MKCRIYMPIVAAGIVMMLVGCSSSKQSTEGTTQSPSSTSPTSTTQDRHDQIDTTKLHTETHQEDSAPTQSTPSSSTSTPEPGAQSSTGIFAVQIGANKVQAGADRVAQLARERFTQRVDVLYDATSQLYKVMLGSFLTREDARNFRDEIFRKYPTDYKDAWVSERPQK